MAGTTPTIKVLVACHKPVACPESDIYLPVQLGAAGAAEPIFGAQPDSEGDNISDRNFSFCELTAQYWAWKNLDADYIGLCHYRRYFCFDGIAHPKNDHAQIEIACLSPYSAAQYRLDDADLIREAVAGHDIIAPEHWSVRGVPTPLGPQSTIRSHMLAYGLMDENALDTLVSLCRERQPEYAPFVEAYLSGHQYQGYNCFIMRRDLFDRFCEFEFDVLLAFDAQFDYTHLTTTKKRIAGYLGEILVSAFTMKIEAEGSDIARHPLTFFEDTPAPARLGSDAADEQATKLVWNYPLTTPFHLIVGLESLARSLGDKPCDVSVVTPAGFDRETALRLVGTMPDTLRIEWATWPAIEGLPLAGTGLSEDGLACIAPFMLPWLMPDVKRAIWCEGALVFNDGFPHGLDSLGGGLHAGVNVFLQRELNKPGNRSARGLLALDDAEQPLGAYALAADLEALREALTRDDMTALYAQTAHSLKGALEAAHMPCDEPLFGMLVRAGMLNRLGCAAIPFAQASPGLDRKDTRRWADEDTALEWLAASAPALISFDDDGMPDPERRIMHADAFWSHARATAAYEALLRLPSGEGEAKRLIDKILPVDSKRRALARTVATALKPR